MRRPGDVKSVLHIGQTDSSRNGLSHFCSGTGGTTGNQVTGLVDKTRIYRFSPVTLSVSDTRVRLTLDYTQGCTVGVSSAERG
jgi:hypothetical protein